jgi:nucleoside permease NupC
VDFLIFSKQGTMFVFGSWARPTKATFQSDFRNTSRALGRNPTILSFKMRFEPEPCPDSSLHSQVLTTIIFFSALLSVLYYLGVMQRIVFLFAKIMARTIRVSGAESLSNSANIFVGQTEAPLPAAFIMAKVMVPEKDEPLTLGEVKLDVPVEDGNILDAAANGSTVGWQLMINVTAMLTLLSP